MKVFVVNKHGHPLMPTTTRKARLLLKSGKARIDKRTPFTIQLVYGSSGYKQEVRVGIDSGYQNIGFSAVTDKEELWGGEVKMMTGIMKRLTERAKYRRQRRNRLRYRKSRFDNRRRCRDAPWRVSTDGWLAPSIQHKLDTHFKVIEMIRSVLRVSHLTIEVADFDIQKIMNPDIQGKMYQEGEQLGFSHLRQYILHRDNHKCQNTNCKNKAKESILQVHHLGFWKEDRSDRPGNLITLCCKCHVPKNHNKSGFLYGWEPKVKSFKPETFMSTVKKRLWAIADSVTFGCETKVNRKALGITEKSHHSDAFVIAGGTNQQRYSTVVVEQVRRHKRSMEQFYDAKYIDSRNGQKKSGSELSSGRRTRNKQLNSENLRVYRQQKLSQGQRRIKIQKYPYKQGDLVRFKGKIFAVVGMQNKGKGVKLANYPGIANKVVKPSAVKSMRKTGGLIIHGA